MKLIYPEHLKLLPFQQTAIEQTLYFLTTNPANACYNACEMGLGKTIQAIVALNTLGCRKILIICPAIMRLVWAEEWCKWHGVDAAEGLNIILDGKDADSLVDRSLGYGVVITSYNLASSRPFLTWLESQIWDALVLDESHYVKSSRAQRTKACLGCIWPVAHYKLALSGTPFTTRVVDGWTLFRRMVPKQWPDFDAFADEHSYKQIKRIGSRTFVDYFGVKNPARLREIIRSNFYVRYTKEEVLTELPPKQYNKITLPISYAVLPRGRTEKEKLEAEAELVRRAIENERPVPIPASLAEHRRLQGERKVGAVAEFIKDLLDQEIPVVCFAWHKNVIASLAAEFGTYRPAVVTGATEAQQRKEEVERFQSGSTLLFIGNMLAAGVGITLTASSTAVLAELDWSPAVVSQSIDRLHRISQKNTVNVYYFVVENSIDEAITNIVMSRARTFKSVLDGESSDR